MGFFEVLSFLFGWIYTFCWSASFYPQLILNIRRKSTSGTTVDFPLLNVLGFATYFASNAALYYSSAVRAQYAARNHGLTPTVQFNDITFALHALILSLITTSQYLVPKLWGFTPSIGNRPSRIIYGIITGSLTGLVVTYVIIGAAATDSNDALTSWCDLDAVYALGYVKLLVTLIKFTPQLLTNIRNKSTQGWSIWQVLLDLAGGVLSISQLAIDSYLQQDWSGVTGNPIKFFLANVSMIFDAIFIAQHYVIYRHANRQPEPRLD